MVYVHVCYVMTAPASSFLSRMQLFLCLQLHFEVPLSPVIAAKKARPSDGGSDEVGG